MALCKAVVLVSALLHIPTSQMRINQEQKEWPFSVQQVAKTWEDKLKIDSNHATKLQPSVQKERSRRSGFSVQQERWIARKDEARERAKQESFQSRKRPSKGDVDDLFSKIMEHMTGQDHEEPSQTARPDAIEQDTELTLKNIQQRDSPSETIWTQSPWERDYRTAMADRRAAHWMLNANGDASYAEHWAIADANIEEALEYPTSIEYSRELVAGTETQKHIKKMVTSRDQVELAETATPELEEQQGAPGVTAAEGTAEEQKDWPTRKQRRHRERNARRREKEQGLGFGMVAYVEELVGDFAAGQAMEQIGGHGQVEPGKATGPEADDQKRVPAVAEAQGSESPEQQMNRLTRTEQAAKKGKASTDADATHGEDKVRHKAIAKEIVTKKLAAKKGDEHVHLHSEVAKRRPQRKASAQSLLAWQAASEKTEAKAGTAPVEDTTNFS